MLLSRAPLKISCTEWTSCLNITITITITIKPTKLAFTSTEQECCCDATNEGSKMPRPPNRTGKAYNFLSTSPGAVQPKRPGRKTDLIKCKEKVCRTRRNTKKIVPLDRETMTKTSRGCIWTKRLKVLRSLMRSSTLYTSQK